MGKGHILDTILLLHDRISITVVMFMFAVGIIGSAIVVVLVAIDDVRDISKPDEHP